MRKTVPFCRSVYKTTSTLWILCEGRRRPDHSTDKASSTSAGKSPIVNLPMLRLLSSKAQEHKDIRKSSKPYHVGTHWIALAEYSQMSTHSPAFQSFFRDILEELNWKLKHFLQGNCIYAKPIINIGMKVVIIQIFLLQVKEYQYHFTFLSNKIKLCVFKELENILGKYM